MIFTMDCERTVFTNGYVAIADGLIDSVGKAEDCNYIADENVGGD
jgi:hypothetical protein